MCVSARRSGLPVIQGYALARPASAAEPAPLLALRDAAAVEDQHLVDV